MEVPALYEDINTIRYCNNTSCRMITLLVLRVDKGMEMKENVAYGPVFSGQ